MPSGPTDVPGLQYRRARYYDPLVGQFTQIDPIGMAGGMNLYGYANGDPVNFRDPSGLDPECLHRNELGVCTFWELDGVGNSGGDGPRRPYVLLTSYVPRTQPTMGPRTTPIGGGGGKVAPTDPPIGRCIASGLLRLGLNLAIDGTGSRVVAGGYKAWRTSSRALRAARISRELAKTAPAERLWVSHIDKLTYQKNAGAILAVGWWAPKNGTEATVDAVLAVDAAQDGVSAWEVAATFVPFAGSLGAAIQLGSCL